VSLDFLADEAETPAAPTAPPWKIAVIDDVAEVHETTRLALSGISFEGRDIELVSAYSAAEAKALFQRHRDIAVALVDVVMESETAGLDLVEWLRESLGDRMVRIILRTGQPGYAPETNVIARYEIDDYKEKTELSRTKLVTSLITAFRGYRQLEAIDRNRAGLERLIQSLSKLYSRQAVDAFANGILSQLSALLDVEPDGVVCAIDTDGQAAETYRILAAGGALESYTGRPIEALPNAGEADLIRRCIESGETLCESVGTAIALTTNKGAHGAVFIQLPREAIKQRDAEKLLRLFAINASVAYDNASLFEETRMLAFTDPVTGLQSFGAFCKTFHTLHHPGRDLVVALFDIHKFREMSHGLGEERAEILLKKIGDRLKQGLEGVLALARREADEFALLLDADAAADPETLIARIDRLFDDPIVIDDATLAVRGRLGLARTSVDGGEPRTLARYAAIALNELRQRGRGYVKTFEPSLQESASERLQLASMLTGSSAKTEFRVAFQPIFDAAQGAVRAAEALMRFVDATGASLPTGKMIDAAEANGLILDLGAWVLREAMTQHAGIVADLETPPRLNINLSPAQMLSRRIYADIEQAVARSGLCASLLNLEVTENLFLEDDDESQRLLRWLRERGARIYIDDFGTGYSSLSYLSRLPVDGLKIDRSFVMRMDDDPQAIAVVKSVIAIGHELGLDVVAEGVETATQKATLTRLGAHKLQGFLLARPGPVAALGERLARPAPA
jgi:EAL domain-containing protein (putative c-di-GMP-specific phosphodiesterase class I)/GGDEF domain-containing protein/CheY-like chemotaxis protein